MKKCPNCGAQMNDDSLFCTECGKQIPQGNVCSHCGALVNNGDAFCQNCGNKVDGGDGQQVPPVTTPEQKHCPHCGAVASNDGLFCESCGRSMADGSPVPNMNFQNQVPYETGRSSQNKMILPIIIIAGLLIIAIAGGGGWWYYKSSNALKKSDVTIDENVASTDSIVSVDANSKEHIISYLNDILPKAIKMEEQQAVEKYFTKEFADLYKKIEIRDSKINAEGNIGFWDFDFWTGSQDGELASIKVVDISDLSQNKATALIQYVIKFGSYDESKSSNRLDLVFENGNWQIDDLNNYKDRFKDFLESFSQSRDDSNSYIKDGNGGNNEVSLEKDIQASAKTTMREQEERLPQQSETSNKVYETVEHMPSFPGGAEALFRFLNSNMRYPVVAEENGIQGRVIVTFIVERDGAISEVQVAKSVDPSLDKEAVRIIKSMPRWNPGTQDGKPVRVKYTVPVTFKLQ